MSVILESLLQRDSLKHHMLSWIKFQGVRRVRQANSRLAGLLESPEVPKELLEDVPTELYILREMTFTKLAELAMCSNSRAIREIVTRVQETSDKHWLCCWGLDTLRSVAEPGEAWLLRVILAPGGPLTHSNGKVRVKALEILAEGSGRGSYCSDAIVTVAGMLNDPDNSVCETAGRSLVRITHGATGAKVNPVAIQSVVEQLRKGRTEARMSAARVLMHVAPRGDGAALEALQKVLQADKQMSVRFFAATALAEIAEQGNGEVISTLEACMANEWAARVRGACKLALKRLSLEESQCDSV